MCRIVAKKYYIPQELQLLSQTEDCCSCEDTYLKWDMGLVRPIEIIQAPAAWRRKCALVTRNNQTTKQLKWDIPRHAKVHGNELLERLYVENQNCQETDCTKRW
jgi:hypothetical protein